MSVEPEKTVEQQTIFYKNNIGQLRIELSMDRCKVSETAKDIVDFCFAGIKDDPMLTPVGGAENPYLSANKACQCLLQ